jgi:hypothetical protein
MKLSESGKRTPGDVSRQVRYEAEGEPLYAGLCYCIDGQRARRWVFGSPTYFEAMGVPQTPADLAKH